MDTADIQDVACHWLSSVLFGQEPSNDISLSQTNLLVSASLEDARADMFDSDYVFSRGKKDKDKDKEGKGEMHGSFDVKGSEKEVHGGASVKGSYDFGNGMKVEGKVYGGAGRNENGDVRAGAGAEVSGSYGF